MERVVAFVCVLALAAAGEEVPGVVHVHSTWSGGALTVREVAERARDVGLRAVVLSDGYDRNARWGPPPLAGLVSRTEGRPSVRRADLAAWLAEIQAAQRVVPEVAIVPGLELSPVCVWSGSPWGRGLRAEGLHVHLLAVGARPAEAYASLPSPTDGPLRWDGECASRCFLAIGAAIAAVLFLRGGARRPALAACLLLAAAWQPLRRETIDGGSTEEGTIAAARAAGLATVWAHPEALAPTVETEVSGVRARTLPYPDRLLLAPTAAFAAVYGDLQTASGIGREWDRALLDHVEGRRAEPLWGIGEADFDGNGAVSLDTYQTVFLVDRPGTEGVETALARGACWAAFAPGGKRVAIALRVTDEAGGNAVGMGGTLAASGRASVHAEAGGAGEGRLQVVLNGVPWKETTGALPLALDEPLDPPQGRSYLRVIATRKEGGGSLGNPIFVERRP